MMRFVKPIISVFILIFALLGMFRVISFDVVVPAVVVCSAFVTYIDAKKMAQEKRMNDARSLMNAVTLMIALVLIWFFLKFF